MAAVEERKCCPTSYWPPTYYGPKYMEINRIFNLSFKYQTARLESFTNNNNN